MPSNNERWPHHIENGKIYIAIGGNYPELEVKTIEDFIASYEKMWPECVEEFGM